MKKVSYAEFRKITGIGVTTEHTGKMTGIQSLSTSCLTNEHCQKAHKNVNSICHYCFSFAQMKRYANMAPKFARNGERLSAAILDVVPEIPVQYFRFESFGDLINSTQAANYMLIAKHNPDVKFAWFTKRPQIIAEAIKAGYQVPENVTVILSSYLMNKPRRDYALYPFVNKVFTVYDYKSETAAAGEGVTINCGARSCFGCRRCYGREGDFYVNELKK